MNLIFFKYKMKFTSKCDLDRDVENAHTSKLHTIPYKNDKKKEQQGKRSLSKRIIIAVTIGIIIIMIIVFGVPFFLLRKKSTKENSLDVKNEDNENGNNDENNSEPIEENDSKPAQKPEDESKGNDEFLISEELKEVFNPVFEINSKVGTLTQTLMESKQTLKIKTIGSDEYTFFKALIDTFVISEDSPEPSQFYNLYKKKITTSISINSLCFSSEGTDCELIKYLDLSESNNNNLRNAEESNPVELTIPICLIEHTDSNIILSISCPNNLEDHFQSLLKLAFENIKPETIKGAEDEESFAYINIEEKEDKIYINSFSKLCEDEEKDDKTCETQKKIITDKDGNFISSNQINKTETYLNVFEYEYNFKDITSENADNLNTVNFRTNLNILLNLLKNYMQKKTYDDMRRLEEENKGDEEDVKSYFNKFYSVFDFKNSLSNKINLEGKSYIGSEIQINDDRKLLSYNEADLNLQNSIEKFKILSNAINSLATSLFEDMNKILMEMENKTISEFTKINNLLAFRDLLSVFDSSGLNEFPYDTVSKAKDLFTNIKALSENLSLPLNYTKTKLNEDISSFLSDEHNLINKLFNNLEELNNLLTSKKSKLAIIASFYESNSPNTAFMNIAKSARDILDNYYIYEKDKIKQILKKFVGNFENNSLQLIENEQFILDNITNRLEDNSIVINSKNKNDSNIVIENLQNVKNIEKEIIPKVSEIMEKNIFQSNGYLVTDEFIEEYKESYSPIIESSLNIANVFSNNQYIDVYFDEIMKYFREQFIVILKYIETSKSENFPIKSNVLDLSFEALDTLFNNEKINIKNFLENNNKEFLNSINDKINSFSVENQNILSNLIANIENNLSKINLDNISHKYDDMINYAINNITIVLDINYNLASAYLHDINSTIRLTPKIKNSMTEYLNKLNEIESYIKLELKSDFVNKYKNITNQFKKGLQSIKSNLIIKKYYENKDLSFFKKHIELNINQLILTLDDFISDEIFDSKYLTTINDFIKSSLNKINTQRKELNEKYFPISQLDYQSDAKYDLYHNHSYRCCKNRSIVCVKKDYCVKYYSKSVNSTNNYKKLLSILFDSYSKDLDSQFIQIYNNFSENINSYNNIIASLGDDLEMIINDYSQKKLDSLNSISEASKSFLNDKLGINILKSSYNYYKNDLNEKIPTELNSIFDQWKNLFDKVYQDIKANINKFKYPIEEFSTLAMIYYEYYRQNISYSYSESIVEQRKYDFNSTIKYYYNLFLSKVNQTYTYILNNIPSNENFFDNILKNKSEQVNNSYNEIVNLASESQKEILNLKKQLKTFKVSETNFFEVNSLSVDLSYKIEEELAPLIGKIAEITEDAMNKYDSVESVSSSFYLENMENGRDINELLNNINIEFQYEEYQTLFEEVLKIDIDDLKNKILDFLTSSNKEIKSIFKTKRNNYKIQLQEKIFSILYNKADLEKEINVLYSEGLNNLDDNSKNLIVKYIDEIIEKIKDHLLKESSRLSDESTSYSNNYNIFIQRLNQYKNKIYDEFYSIIHSVTKDFYIDIKQKFYSNYIEKHLDDLYESVKKGEFSEINFLNNSINSKEIIDEDIQLLILEYKNWAINHINFLNEKKIQSLNELFLFEKLKTGISNKIDDLYQTLLLPTLKKKATYNSGDEGVSDYDFSETIINDIDTIINTKINEAKIQIEKMKGNKYEINENWKIPDFSNVQKDIFEDIINDFNNNFSDIYKSKEINDFYNVMSTNLKSNFNQTIDNFISSFGKDYFDRLLKYNEIQKIKALYENLDYSLSITLTYYFFLTYSNSMASLPKDLEIKIMSLNNIDSRANKKSDELISLLNTKFEEFLEETKNNLVEKYINYIKTDNSLKNNFNTNIIDLLSSILDNKKDIFEDEYMKMMNSDIKEPFIGNYAKILKESQDNLINFISENKEQITLELKDLLIDNKEENLHNIETKINDTLNLVEEIEKHFDSFKISKEIEDFLNNFAEKKILSLHQDINNIWNQAESLIVDNINANSKDYANSYLSENIEYQLSQINILFRNSFFNKMNEYLSKYGTTDSIYLSNLEKEITNVSNKRNRRLEEIQEGFADLKLDNTFKSLKASSKLLKQKIQTLDLFSNFEDNINKYINTIKEQYELSKISIKNRNYTEEIIMRLYESLEELKELSISYYNKVKVKYDEIKKYIEDSIINIDSLIEKCSDITYNVINDKYKEIKNNFKEINNKIDKSDKIDLITKNIIDSNTNYQIQATIDELIIDNEFLFNIIIEDGKYKLKGKSINKNRPKSFVVDFSIKKGKCVNIGKIMTINLDNISSIIDFEFDSSSLKTQITKKDNIPQYFIDNKFYKEIETNDKVIFGNTRVPKIVCKKELIDTPDGEKDMEIISAKIETIKDSL